MTDVRSCGFVSHRGSVVDTIANKTFRGAHPERTIEDVLAVVLEQERSKVLQITQVGTWACPCTCPYCFVKHQLMKGPDAFRKTNLDSLAYFLDQQKTRRPIERVHVNMLGGEPLLSLDLSIPFIECIRSWSADSKLKFQLHITSSLSVPLKQRDIDFLKGADIIVASIDGTIENHDANRGKGKFACAIRNLSTLVQAGCNVIVQAALPQNLIADTQFIRSFLISMYMCGLAPDKVTIAGISTTPEYTKGVVDIKETKLMFNRPCCAHRFMSQYVIHGDDIYSSFFDVAHTRLGSLSDDYDKIREAYVGQIKKMPIFQDPGCSDCPVIGWCWGRCIGDMKFATKPSENCNRKQLIAQAIARIDQFEEPSSQD